MALTAEQAAKRLGRTERTIRRWIQDGKITAFHPTLGRVDKFLIEESEVERLKAELAQYELPEQSVAATEEQDYASLIERVSQLETRITALEQEVSELRSLLSQRATIATEPLETPVAEQRHRTYAPRATASTVTPEDIPPGSLLIATFAERHGVNPRTFRDQVTKGVRSERIAALEIDKLNRPGEKERWLSPALQRDAIAFWIRHGTHFEACTDNPECRCHSR